MSHWSDLVTWRAGRWDPMSNAPRDGTEIRARVVGGKSLEPVKFEREAWRKRGRSVAAEEWQPIRAEQKEEMPFVWPFPINNAEHHAWLMSKVERVRAQSVRTQ